jgi:uncharacterized flavoprotein (TIGR03862 family)
MVIEKSKQVAIVGSGPAGLFAAEIIARAGHAVTVYDQMPSPARKFLMAGRGGLNLTHSEPIDAFLSRYSENAALLRNAICAFTPDDLIAWANALGAETFIGSSGRVFPKSMKASPLLRAWLKRLDDLGVAFRFRHRWTGFADNGGLTFTGPDASELAVAPDAALIATGGASWPRLGSDGAWVDHFKSLGVTVAPLVPANSGVEIAWSSHFVEKFAGAPLKRIAITIGEATRRGEAVITKNGLEGGVVYALGPEIRRALSRARGSASAATMRIDLKPDMREEDLAVRLEHRRSTQSMSNVLRKSAGLSPAAINLLREVGPLPTDATTLAHRSKGAEFRIIGLSAIARAISTAGGIDLAAVSPDYELKARPRIFVAGEMLDWEAPTGGYLLQGAFATAAAAARGLLMRLTNDDPTLGMTNQATASHQEAK